MSASQEPEGNSLDNEYTTPHKMRHHSLGEIVAGEEEEASEDENEDLNFSSSRRSSSNLSDSPPRISSASDSLETRRAMSQRDSRHVPVNTGTPSPTSRSDSGKLQNTDDLEDDFDYVLTYSTQYLRELRNRNDDFQFHLSNFAGQQFQEFDPQLTQTVQYFESSLELVQDISTNVRNVNDGLTLLDFSMKDLKKSPMFRWIGTFHLDSEIKRQALAEQKELEKKAKYPILIPPIPGALKPSTLTNHLPSAIQARLPSVLLKNPTTENISSNPYSDTTVSGNTAYSASETSRDSREKTPGVPAKSEKEKVGPQKKQPSKAQIQARLRKHSKTRKARAQKARLKNKHFT